MIAYRLNKPIDIKSVAKNIINIINEHSQENEMNDAVLTIEVKNISHTVDELIGKLENSLEKLNDEKSNVSEQS